MGEKHIVITINILLWLLSLLLFFSITQNYTRLLDVVGIACIRVERGKMRQKNVKR